MLTRFQSPLILGYLGGLILFFAPIIGFFAPKGLAPLIITGSILGCLILWIQGRKIKWLGLPMVVILVCFCLWAMLSSFWSADAVSSSLGSVRLFGNFLAGGILFSATKNLIGKEKNLVFSYSLIGFVIAVCFVVIEILLDGPIFIALKGVYMARAANGVSWLNPVIVVLSLFVWPVMLGIYQNYSKFVKKKYLISFIASGFIGVLLLSVIIGFSSGIIALLFGIFGAFLIFLFKRRFAMTASVLLTMIAIIMPFGFNVFQDPIAQINSVISIPPSAEHRIGIWKFASEKISDKPLVGWGMNASKNIPGGRALIFSKEGKQYGRALPLHPHNVILQTWLELGLVGIMLFVGFCILIIINCVKPVHLPLESAAIFGQFITILVISNISFGMWQAWWIATIWLSASLMVLVVKLDKGTDIEVIS